MKSVVTLRWEAAVAECRLHQKRLSTAKPHVDSMRPFESDDIASLSDEACAWLDQFLYRFTKLQDVMGERLFPACLQMLGEDFSGRPFIDSLNRLEALELIPSRDWWLYQRELRNQIAHEYPERISEQCSAINAICDECDDVLRVMNAVINTVSAVGGERTSSA